MISASKYWKQPLITAANWLSRSKLNANTRQSTLVKIQKEVFLGFYSVRKLIEAFEVKSELESLKIEIIYFPKKPRSELINDLNKQRIEHLYEMSAHKSETRDIKYISNLFIHSYVFIIIGQKNKLKGFYINTDTTKNEKLYFIDLIQIFEIFRLIGKDKSSNLTYKIDQAKGDVIRVSRY